jgi:hypothetical protein
VKRWTIFLLLGVLLLIPAAARGQAPYLIFNHPTDCSNPDGDDLGDSGSDSDSRSDIGPISSNIWICVYEQTTFTFHGDSSACGKTRAYGDIQLYDASAATLIETLATYDTYQTGCVCDSDGIIVDHTLGAGYYRLYSHANAMFSTTCPGGSSTSVAASTCQSFCSDGTEILTERTPLYNGDVWTGSGSGYNNQRVRFTYFVPSDSSSTLLGEINGESGTINASGAVSQSTVIPTESVSGPTAHVTLTHQSGARTDLLSVCLLDAGGGSGDPGGDEPPGAPECLGIEALDDFVEIAPYSSWSDTEDTTYNDMWVRYAFWNSQDGVAQLGINGYMDVPRSIGMNSADGYADAFFMRTVPQWVGGPTANLDVINSGDSTLTLVSACLLQYAPPTPVPGRRGPMAVNACINSDPELDNPNAWLDSTGTWGNGEIYLAAGQRVHRQLYLSSANYVLSVEAESGDIPQTLVIGDTEFDAASDFLIQYPFEVEVSTGNDMPYITAHNDNWQDITVSYVCIRQDYLLTPTPVPPPPTPSTGCVNPDPEFDLPEGSVWIAAGATIDDGMASIAAGGLVYEITDLEAGLYRVSMTTRGTTGNSIRVSENDSTTGDVFSLYGNGVWQDYPSFNMELGDDPTLIISALDSNHENIEVGYFCLQRIEDTPTPTATPTTPTPTPRPTQTPGGPPATATGTATTAPTETPIPTATPNIGPGDPGGVSGCINDDPGIDSTQFWATKGGSIAGSVASLPASASLYENVSQADDEWTYYVTIQAKSLLPTELTLDWRGQTQGFTLPGDDTWEKVTLVVLPPQQLQRQAQSQSEDAPSLADPFNLEPVSRPARRAPLWSLSPLYGVSPLREPSGPQPIGGDNLLYITALAGNTVPVEIDSVCVSISYQGDAPIDDGEPVEFWSPVCDRDYVVQQAFQGSSSDPIMRLGSGDRPGMPIHAIQDGTITDFGPAASYVFGGKTYAGCIVIDHVQLNVSVTSYYCGIEKFNVPQSGNVKRGGIIGYIGDWSEHDYENRQLVHAIMVNSEWIDPDQLFDDYPECYPYNIILPDLPDCEEEDSVVHPKFEYQFNVWVTGAGAVVEALRWVTYQLYDTIGYPVLCGLVLLYNRMVRFLTQAVNAVIEIITPAWIFFYRVEKIISYVLARLGTIFEAIVGVINAIWQLLTCIKRIIQYFITAFVSAASAEYEIASPAPGNYATNALGVLWALMSKTVANVIFLPISIIGIAYMAWNLVTWGVGKLRQSVNNG